ncbi:WhiB family transcriptional regulator [Streptomyces sp. NBC_01242]|uniref:WhiB family transcriptional regulator n=1 Tax=Streptomyces sp. NBC_01242 TaxID=2903795 RepID=UPI0022536ABE|nr:WhiB family transcriptional regulator [Streptomyces sp. NBC_01242]MCX4799700.1 WhiB family transcriptional regulator [Streptomyces sp. NBC_01242]
MTSFPCSTAPALFDTMGGPDDPDVRKAKGLCHGCPAIFTCRQQGRDGREWGVWGGESQVERYRVVSAPEGDDRPECGTYVALQVHRALEEECETCLEARRARERAYDAKRRAGKKLVEAKQPKPRGGARVPATCPSPAAYKRHHKKGEDPGPCGCREAYSAARKAEREATKKPRKLAACPSVSAYRRHNRYGEDPGPCGCREAYRASEVDRHAKAKKAKEEVA